MSNLKKPPRQALGRGLRALISTPSVSVHSETQEAVADAEGSTARVQSARIEGPGDAVAYVDIDKIFNNEAQPRKEFDRQELQELADSIAALGVIQPIVVRPLAQIGHYEIVAGERRWRAATLAGLSQVPVIIKDLGNRETLEVALVENIQRSGLLPTEEARAYQNLMDEFNLTQKDLAERVGKDRATIANSLRLLRLPPEVLSLLDGGALSMGHAKAILTAKEPAVQRSLAQKCVSEGLSVRAIEEIVARVVVLDNKRAQAKAAKAMKSDFPEVADRLRNSLGTKVMIKHDKKKERGKLIVEYFSEAELDRLVEMLAR